MKQPKIINITAEDYNLYGLSEDGKIYQMDIPSRKDEKPYWRLYADSPTRENTQQ
jgi:hypothetical protein